ncbi:hypothetical protein [Actinomycetospora cinnamomea]|uniref:Uncharacterized protein n=1 Tax=Actinomycetospora cinnamomea TaxID=663609 RepID=A0A2U1F2E0_9PSEU|nr:hypothetical protein [Actinomycetospora cinnamomea]PVZ06353.1 hypothetical protein C8D89_11391 [Actinomycetospora cinnamomea]
MATANAPTVEPEPSTDVVPTSAAPAERVGDVLDRSVRRGAVLVDRVREQLPRPVPVYLGIGALAVTGVVSWPVAVAAGCGYAALRHWEPQPSGMPMEDHR